jgi:hypothetical protein
MILVVAILGAILFGVLTGGSARRLANLPLRAGWIALVAFSLQIYIIYFPEPVSEGFFSPRVGLLIFSVALLFVFVWKNRLMTGMWLIALGFLANLGVMLLNGGYMPITEEAIAQVGRSKSILSSEPYSRVRATKDIVLPREATLAWWLSDIFILPPPFPVPTVFSLGDLLIAVGAFWLIQSGMQDSKERTKEQ